VNTPVWACSIQVGGERVALSNAIGACCTEELPPVEARELVAVLGVFLWGTRHVTAHVPGEVWGAVRHSVVESGRSRLAPSSRGSK
jgi:hypothetical protein